MKFQIFIQKHNNQITLASAILIVTGYLSKFLFANDLGFNVILATASVIAAIPIMIHAYQSLRAKVISIELLVSIAVIGAFIIGEFNESAIVTFLFQFGGYLEQRTLTKTRQSIKSLTEMAPSTALLVNADGTTSKIDVDDVAENDVVLVKTGASVPVDGEVIDGHGYTDESVITGESKAISKQVNDNVFSGTIVSDGFLKVKATKVGDDTTFAKIIDLVEEAEDTKSHAEKFIDRFAKYYTPAVLIIALIVFVITRDFKLAITVLVLGCPGALVIGAPVSNVAGIGNGAKRGILVKGGEAMDSFAKIDTFMFDKTGTLTTGKTSVTEVNQYNNDVKTSISYAAKIESLSDHPLGRAIVNYANQQKISFSDYSVDNNQAIKGQGIDATVNGHHLLLGNKKMMDQNSIKLSTDQANDLTQLQKKGSSNVIVAIDHQIVLIIGIADVIRPEVADKLLELRNHGAKHLIMLTGDNQATATYVGNQVGIDTVYAELMPEQKLELVKEYQSQGNRVAFVGDGINDSPSIATADIGIAMGSGTDVAIETSDIVLMKSNFNSLVHAYGLAKKTVLNTKENITIAIGVVAFLLFGLVAGFIYMASGMFVHEASILVVIFNAMRLISYGNDRNSAKHHSLNTEFAK